MAFVLDASVTASWFFPDENDQDAWEAWRRSEKEQMWAPLHWWFEVRNTMLVGERKKRLSKALTSRALSRLSVLPISIDPRPDDNAVFNLARTHRLTFYDEGVGTRNDGFRDGVFGAAVFHRVRRAYCWLADTYESGDQVIFASTLSPWAE